MFEVASYHGTIDLYICHTSQVYLVDYYLKTVTVDDSDEEVSLIYRSHEKAKKNVDTVSFKELVAWEKEEVESLSVLRSPYVWKNLTDVGNGKGKVLLDDFEAVGNGKGKVLVDDFEAVGNGKGKVRLDDFEAVGDGKSKVLLDDFEVVGNGKGKEILYDFEAVGNGKGKVLSDDFEDVGKDKGKGDGYPTLGDSSSVH
nr:phospholipase-like protein [Tanacetum cinerariifolium]